MSVSSENPWLARYAAVVAGATLVLICAGGLVTSHGVGMAVPDWPNTYGYNMFLFPVSQWVGGIFYEHTHRLIAAGVGFLTVLLACWLWFKEERRWVRWLGIGAVVAVIVQGILGGLRVVFDRYGLGEELGILHATVAQLFFALTAALALVTSRIWLDPSPCGAGLGQLIRLRALFLLAAMLILAQLIVGATMRHQHAGLAISDFPLAYGELWPALDSESVSRYNQQRMEVTVQNPITAFQIGLQMVHRIVGVVIFLLVVCTSAFALRVTGVSSVIGKLSTVWLVLIVFQLLLGAATIWSNKSADIATAHVAVGALSLVTGICLILLASRYLYLQAKETCLRAECGMQDSAAGLERLIAS